MSVRIVTDSGCDLSPDAAEALGISVVPLSIRFGAAEYTDRVDLSPARFYAEMDTQDDLPETAAPAPGAFAAVFEQLVAEGATDIVCVMLSEALSATAQSARTAASQVTNASVHIVDSKSATVGQGTLVMAAASAAAAGSSADEVVALTQAQSAATHVFGILDTLDNLKKGGRIGNAQALLGTMLSIKPCIDLSSGAVEEAGKQRTRKKALAWLASVVPENATNLAVGHGQASDIDDFLALLDRTPDRIDIIGPVVGTHGGPGVIGLTFTV